MLPNIEQQVLIFLTYFTPLIQLWAGICLLFFYVKLLDHSPLESHIDKVSEDLLEIRNRFQGIIDDDKNLDFSLKWGEYFLPRVKNMAALTFFYCLFILLAIGFGRYCKWELSNGEETKCAEPVFLLITSLCVLGYNICCSLINKNCFRTYVTPIGYAVVLILLYFLTFEPVEGCLISFFSWIEDKTGASAFVLILVIIVITSIYGMVSVLAKIIKDRIIIWRITSRLKDINLLLAAYMAKEPFSALPEKFQECYRDSAQINGDGTVTMTRTDLMTFIESEIKRRYTKV